MSHITKIIEKAILVKLEQIGSDLFSTARYQTGFKKGSLTAFNLTKLLECIGSTRRKSKSRKAYIFVDLKKAYDSVSRVKLFEMLRKRCRSE